MKLNTTQKILVAIVAFVVYLLTVGLNLYFKKPFELGLSTIFAQFDSIDYVAGIAFVLIVLYSLARKPKKRY